ncbi:Transmembrane protein 65 [Eufriesea mexicana]|uniref:Transmembrane protein 65 n=1 Tax=Eufriesea mexicana TaxID=516756 RepID=A0A310SCS0_9HYME|nr:Transmembrane protein 65 [Eufriesea mexicana]
MRMTIAALTSQTLFIPREIMYFSRNISRFYHSRQKLCCMNNFQLGKHSLFPLVVNTWTIPKTYYSNESKIAFPECLTKETAKEVASKLTSDERNLFLRALEECKSEEDRAGYQRQLAAFRWCNKLGRPSKIPSLGDVDPTGTYCPLPEDWLMRKYAETVPEPSTKDLVLVAISNAIPFIGFGFLDNFIMIVAGDQIEIILNKKFPISTMAAAALGNTISDIIGIGSVHYVERFAQSVGFKAPKLTPMQLNLRRTKAAANMGRVIGVTIGCFIGMTPIPIFSYFHNGG